MAEQEEATHNQPTNHLIFNKLARIQFELKVPKKNRNTFGNYNYRSAEDILNLVKPLLKRESLILILSDEVVDIAGWHYVKSTATLLFTEQPEQKIETFGFARESEIKKGMDASQITGAASSFARKYAMNGMFAIDETEQDSDAQRPLSDSENDLIMPITNLKGQKFSQIGKEKLAGIMTWCDQNNQQGEHTKLISDIDRFLNGGGYQQPPQKFNEDVPF